MRSILLLLAFALPVFGIGNGPYPGGIGGGGGTNFVVSSTNNFGSLMINTNHPHSFLVQGDYLKVFSYNKLNEAGFTGDLGSGTLIPASSGYYNVNVTISFNGGNSDAIEGAVFTNGVECTSIEFKRTLGAAAAVGSAAASGVVYLVAGQEADFRIKNISDTDAITIYNMGFTISAMSDIVTMIGNQYVTSNYVSVVTLTNQNNIFSATYVDLLDGSAPTYKEGRVTYDTNQHSLAYYSDRSDGLLNVGLELWDRVRNSTGSTITNGCVVYQSGATGQNATIALAIATNEVRAGVIGVATHNITNNTIGYVTTFGLVNDIDTSGFIDGDVVYLSATVPGGLTTNPPAAPSYSVCIGTIEYAHAVHGKLRVNISPQWVNWSNIQNVSSATTNILAGGWTRVLASDYGVTGYYTHSFDDPACASLAPQDVALANCLAAASNMNTKVEIILPLGVIKLTNALEVSFAGVRIAGHGAWGFRNCGYGRATPTMPYTTLWQSNTNQDGLHLNATDMGQTELRDFEITGGSNPTAGIGSAYYYSAPIWSPTFTVTNAANPYSKVGLTIRGKTQIYCGGTKLDNFQVTGFKIGIVNGGNDEIWNMVQMPANDIGLWHCLYSTNSVFVAGLTDLPINANAYGGLIDTNFYGYSGVGKISLGVPDQTTLNNPSFGYRQGGVGIVAGRGNSISIRNSAGISGPKTYALLFSEVHLDIVGGNDEANSDMGTNWIYLAENGPKVRASSWKMQGNAYSRFIYAPFGDIYADVHNITFPTTNVFAAPQGSVSGAFTGLERALTHAGSLYNSYVSALVDTSYSPLAVGDLQQHVGLGWATNQWSGSKFRSVNRPVMMVANPNYFFAHVGSQTNAGNAENFIKFLTTDPINWAEFYTNSTQKTFTNKENYTIDQLSLRDRTVPAPTGTTGVLVNSNRVLYWVTSTKTNLISDGR